MIKKIISFILSILLFVNTAFASSYMNDSILSNVTPMGIYSDPTNNTKYLYGGNVVFKFKDSTKGVPPLFTFVPPKIKAGCNGISVSGGMLSMLGLDGIADQIQNAGTAVVYGIIVGLIYSLPALEKVFAHIRKWAEWLQEILRSSCAQGTNLGKYISDKSGFKDATGKIATFFSSEIDAGNDTTEKIKMQPDQVDGHELTDFIDKLLSGNGSTSTTGKTKDDLKTTYEKDMKEFFKRLGIANMLLYKTMVKDGPYTESEPDYTKIIPNGDEQKELYVLLVNIFGEISVDEKSIDFLKEFGGFIIDMVSNGKSDRKGPRLKEAGQSAELAQSASSSTYKDGLTLAYIPPTLSPERSAKLFIHGETITTNGNKNFLTTELKAPNIVTMKPKSPSKVEAIMTVGITTTPANIQWKGLFAHSKEKIVCEINAGIENKVCTNTFPLVLPGISKYLEIIKQIEIAEGVKNNIAKQETAQTAALKDDLAHHNAYFFAKFILNYVESEFRTNLGKMGKGDISLQFEDNFAKTKEAILKELKEITGTDAKLLDELRNRFKSVELDMAADRRRRY